MNIYDRQASIKKDLFYQSLAFLLLVILPIIAGIYHNLEWSYYLMPIIVGGFLAFSIVENFNIYKRLENE